MPSGLTDRARRARGSRRRPSLRPKASRAWSSAMRSGVAFDRPVSSPSVRPAYAASRSVRTSKSGRSAELVAGTANPAKTASPRIQDRIGRSLWRAARGVSYPRLGVMSLTRTSGVVARSVQVSGGPPVAVEKHERAALVVVQDVGHALAARLPEVLARRSSRAPARRSSSAPGSARRGPGSRSRRPGRASRSRACRPRTRAR